LHLLRYAVKWLPRQQFIGNKDVCKAQRVDKLMAADSVCLSRKLKMLSLKKLATEQLPLDFLV
jgi:hypothetical protein